MSTRNLSLTLFRGIPGTKVKSPLGVHWSIEHGDPASKNPEGASLFAMQDDKVKNTIVHAKAHPGDVVNGYDTEFMEKHQILDAGAPEYEEPLYPGTKVEVTGLTRIRNRGVKTRRISYNPPREMTV